MSIGRLARRYVIAGLLGCALTTLLLTACSPGTAPATAAPQALTGGNRRSDWRGASQTTLPAASPSVIGIALSGRGTTLLAPQRPSYRPYSADCRSLGDLATQTVRCVVAQAPDGTVAGVIEEKRGPAGRAGQERDLVWRREGEWWKLVLARSFQSFAWPTKLWADDLERDGDTKLVFVTRSTSRGYGYELDVVEATGQVVLYRYLGLGFATVPRSGGLVTYVPHWATRTGPDRTGPNRPDAYDQVLIGYENGAWRVFSQQYVPAKAALAQHKGVFYDADPRAVVPAT